MRDVTDANGNVTETQISNVSDSGYLVADAPLLPGQHGAVASELKRPRGSLERYARPGVDAVAAHVAATDPAARRRR